MSELQDRQFIELVHDVFGSTINELGFEFTEESRKLIYAKKGDIQLIFRLEKVPKVYLFGLEIMLTGRLGEIATSNLIYRTLAVTTIAKFFNPEYNPKIDIPSTINELRESMEIQKNELIKYCKGFLIGNTDAWQKIVESIIKDSRWVQD